MLHKSVNIDALEQLKQRQKEMDIRESNTEKESNVCFKEITNDASSNIIYSESLEEGWSWDTGDLCMKDPLSNRHERRKKLTKKQSKPFITFPAVLHDILRDDAFSNIITWLPHGQAFEVLDKKKFEEVVSTKFFNGSCYSSFTKKLNRWNFVCILRGPDKNAYKHKVSY